MSEKKKKNAPAAEAPQPSENSPATAEDRNAAIQAQSEQETTPAPSPSEPAAPVGIQIPPAAMEKIKALGLESYIDPIISWADGLEKRLAMHEKAMEIIAEQMPQKSADIVVRELNKVAAERQKQVMEQMQTGQATSLSGGSGNIGDIIQAAREIMKGDGGGQPNPLQQKFNDFASAVLDRAIKNATEGPPKSAFEKYYEDFIAKKKAEALANVTVT